MTDFEKRLGTLLHDCTEFDNAFRKYFIDGTIANINLGAMTKEDKRLYLDYKNKICDNIKSIFSEVSQTVNVFGVQDLNKLFTSKRMVGKFLYILLRTVNEGNILMYKTFAEDGRSEQCSKLAKIVMEDLCYNGGIPYTERWFKNKYIFQKFFAQELIKEHKLLVEYMVKYTFITACYAYKCEKLEDLNISDGLQAFLICVHDAKENNAIRL